MIATNTHPPSKGTLATINGSANPIATNTHLRKEGQVLHLKENNILAIFKAYTMQLPPRHFLWKGQVFLTPWLEDHDTWVTKQQ